MKLVCDRQDLAAALGLVRRAAAARVGIPALGGVLLDLADTGLTLTSTDLELTIHVRLPVAGHAGRVLVPARTLHDLVQTSPAGEVELEYDDAGLRVGLGSATFRLQTLPADDLPVAASPPPVGGFTLETAALRRAAAQVLVASGRDQLRPVLSGVLFEIEGAELRLVATDDYRLACRTLAVAMSPPAAVLVPSRAVHEVARLSGDDVHVEWSATDIVFRASDLTVRSRLLDAQFPSYRRLLDDPPRWTLHAGRTALLEALRLVTVLSHGTEPVELEIADDQVVVRTSAPQLGEGRETVQAGWDGPRTVLVFNPQYLLDGLQAVDTAEVLIGITDSQSRVVLRAGDYTYVANPIRRS